MKLKISSGLYALFPLLVFFLIFIGSGIYFTIQGQKYAFYQISSSVAILPAIILAVCLTRDPIQKTLNTFLEGVRNNNIIIMCLIYLLAGSFAVVLQHIGGITSIINLSLSFVPVKATLPSLFLLSAFISTAMGTSMGTIAAIGPVGVGIANSIGLPLPLTMGAIIGGAMFGDNLSSISDTTIAATQIHGCSIKEKFKNNVVIALPAMIITLIILSLIGFLNPQPVKFLMGEYQLLQCVPYLLVLGLAILGTNVFVVLVIGILSAGIIGIFSIPSYTLVTLSKDIFEGYKNMTEILILSLLMGGLGELIKTRGGFSELIKGLDFFWLSKKKVGTKTAEGAISAIASLSDICTANNTAAIILSGEATREIAVRYNIPPARTATLVDLFCCVFQGILPYSAQVLMAGSLASVSPLSIIPHVYYCFLLGFSGILFIIFQRRQNKISCLT